MTNSILIAGPCAAESEEQLTATARFLQEQLNCRNMKLDYFRAGVWKPRSKPSEFKGAGKKALPWLKKIQEDYQVDVCVEVAKPEHIDLCEKYGIKTMWIGGRTTVNPFDVDELADCVRGRDLNIMVKNPVIPDLKLWMGSIERFLNAGVSKVMAIHRGFSEHRENVFRNSPLWEIPIELKVQYPEIPLICDPSHIAGDKRYLKEIAQIALDYGFDGLMLETHYRPETALSDVKQQVTPEELGELLANLIFKSPMNSPTEEKLRKQRNLIEHIDYQISLLLRKRMEVVDTIARIKVENNLPIVNPKQFKKVIENYQVNAMKDEIYQEFIKQYLDLLHQTSIKRQQNNE